jgi:hypothetical protein
MGLNPLTDAVVPEAIEISGISGSTRGRHCERLGWGRLPTGCFLATALESGHPASALATAQLSLGFSFFSKKANLVAIVR